MITEQMLDSVRECVRDSMSPKRFNHTAEVEKMAARLGELYAPDKINTLRASALLHDITKEYIPEWHIKVCLERGIELDEQAIFAPKTLHAMSAAAIIGEKFPELATEEIIGCVRWHTTGRAGMTLLQKLIYLADYIDMSRTFEDCVRLREDFFSAQPEKMSMEQRLLHLDSILIESFDMTIGGLLCDGLPISRDTTEARNALVIGKLK